MKLKEIKQLLNKALLQDGEMEIALYEFEMEEHFEYWYKRLVADKDEFVFAVTVHSGDVAMVLITRDKKLYINEEAREVLKEIWNKAYRNNINRLIPLMAQNLSDGNISVNGVKTAPRR